nr:hypothetical protein [Cupriavidus taiwanensis]
METQVNKIPRKEFFRVGIADLRQTVAEMGLEVSWTICLRPQRNSEKLKLSNAGLRPARLSETSGSASSLPMRLDFSPKRTPARAKNQHQLLIRRWMSHSHCHNAKCREKQMDEKMDEAAARDFMDRVSKNLSNPEVIIKGAETDDEIGTVLRMHLLIESVIRFYVTHHPSRPSVKDNFTFFKLANMARAIGMPAEVIETALQINKIRNRLAHDINAKMSSEELEELAMRFDSIGAVFGNWVPLKRRYVDIASLGKGKLTYGSESLRVDYFLICSQLYRELFMWIINPAREVLMLSMK